MTKQNDPKYSEDYLREQDLKTLKKLRKEKGLHIDDLELIAVIQREKTLEDPDSKFELDDANLDKLKFACSTSATQEEIAAFFNINRDTLRKHVVETTGMTWQEFYAHYSSAGNMSIRAMAYRKAKEGIPTYALLWLKKYCGFNETEDKEVQLKFNEEDIQRIKKNLQDKF